MAKGHQPQPLDYVHPGMNRRSFLMAGATAPLLYGAVTAAAEGSSGTNSTATMTDMEVMREALAIHPGAQRYLNPVAMASGLDQLEQALASSGSITDRYLAVSRFLGSLQCGHTYCNFYNQSAAVKDAILRPHSRLPFDFRWLDQQMVVTRFAIDEQLTPGSRVLEVNGIPVQSMLDALLPFTRADGSAPLKRRALLEIQGRQRIEYFDVFHGLVFGEPADGVFHLACEDPNQRPYARTVPAWRHDDRLKDRERDVTVADGKGPLGWRFEQRAGLGVLTMDTWSTYKTDDDWLGWLNDCLDQVSSLAGLIIDNRQNEGGDPAVGQALLSRLTDRAIALPHYQRVTRFATFPAALRPFVGTWDESFYTVGQHAPPIGGGYYRLPMCQQGQTITPRSPRVPVPVALLTSPTNSSASFTFAQLMKTSGRGLLIGEPTGGNLRGINGDGFFFTTLPQSGIEFDLPMVGRYPETPQPDRPIMPDVPVSDTQEDIASGRDAAMAAAVEVLLS